MHPDTAFGVDIEQKVVDDAQIINTTVRNFAWKDVTVTIKDNKSREPKTILDSSHGIVGPGKWRISI